MSIAEYKKSVIANCDKNFVSDSIKKGQIVRIPSVEQWINQQLNASGLPSSQLKLLGRGAFGSVYQFGPKTVVKISDIPNEDACISLETEAILPNLMQDSNECKRSGKCSIPNVSRIARLFDESTNSLKSAIFMRFLDGGSAERLLEDNSGFIVPQVWLQNVNALFHDLQSMHEDLQFVHRDIKPENLLIENSTRLFYLADYGLSCYNGPDLQTPNRCTNGMAGTPGYLPLDILKKGQNSPASDVFALAVTLMEIVIGERYFTRAEVQELQLPLFQRNYGPISKDTRLLFADIYVRNSLVFLKRMKKILANYQQTNTNTPLLGKLIFSSICIILMANPVIARPPASVMISIFDTPDDRLTPRFNPFLPVVSNEQIQTFLSYFENPPSFQVFYKFLSHIYAKPNPQSPEPMDDIYMPGAKDEYVEYAKRDPILQLPRSMSIQKRRWW